MNSVRHLDKLYKELQALYPDVALDIARDAEVMLDVAEHSPEKFITMLDECTHNFECFLDEIKMHNARYVIKGGK